MKCSICGKEIRDNFKFCPKCGTKIIAKEAISNEEGSIINDQVEASLSTPQKILLCVGIIAILANVYLLFLGDYNPEKDFRYLPAILVIVGLSAPISFLSKCKNSDDEYLYAIIAAIVGLILSIVAGFIFKDNANHSFLTDFFNALSSNGFSVFYLVLLIITLIISWQVRKYGIIAISFLIGFLLPMIIAAIIYMLLIIIGLVLVIIFALGNRGGSTRLSSGVDTNINDGDKSNSLYVYDIEYEDERGYLQSRTKSYRNPQSYDQVAADFKSVFWGNGINIRITNIKERKYT